MLRSVSVLTLVGVFAAVCASPVAAQRVGASKKGSILVYPKVELKWNAAGEVIQDTFVTVLNDYPDDVFLHWYFVNGDEPLDAIFAGDPPTQVEPAHPGWNWVNCVTMLTQNEPTYFSALTGSGGCQSRPVNGPITLAFSRSPRWMRKSLANFPKRFATCHLTYIPW